MVVGDIKTDECSQPKDETDEKHGNSEAFGETNAVKKERRKPELQLYRPGMGLSNKNTKNQAGTKENDALPSKPESQEPITNGNVSESTSVQSEEKGSRSRKYQNKTKRPDQRVYTPKSSPLNEKTVNHAVETLKPENSVTAKIDKNSRTHDNISTNDCRTSKGNSSTRVPEKSDTAKFTSKNEHNSEKTDTALPESDFTSNLDKSSMGKRTRSRGKKPQRFRNQTSSDSLNNTDHGSQSYSVNSSWADIVEESERSNWDDIHSCSVSPKYESHADSSHQISNVTCNSAGSGQRIRRNSNRSDAGNKKSEYNTVHTNETANRQNASDRRYGPKRVSLQNSSEKSIHKQENSDIHRTTCANIPVQRTRTTSESGRSKSDWIEPTTPPRLLRNKDNSSSNRHGGGILKLPPTQSNSQCQSVNVHVAKPIQEPKTYIHKQLFNPNNPSKPEIINIPAPCPVAAPFSKPSSSYYGSDPTYIPPPVSNCYIPPPQPSNSRPASELPDMEMLKESGIGGQVMNQSDSYDRSLCFGETSAEPIKKRLKPIVERNLLEIVMLEKSLTSLTKNGFDNANLNSLKQCRWKLQLRYENIILADPKYCAEKNPEHSLWKTVFYNMIEILRKKMEEDEKNQQATKDILLNIILEASMFYENLLEKQQETHGFSLSKIFEMEHVNSSCFPEHLKLLLISVQKSLIYLGDLARYKEQACQTMNFGSARSFYLKAQQIAPKNGRPYHQLALLAFNTRRKLDAVYYYMRSLAASNPFLSAKESLLSLFDEAKKKYEYYRKKKSEQALDEKEEVKENTDDRYEIWIKADGSSTQRPAESIDNIDSTEFYKTLSDIELNKRFVSSFLHTHGMLFTKVGMETFSEVLDTMLKEFYFLLQRVPLPITSTRLLQLLAINIYSVSADNFRDKGMISILHEKALYSSMLMMSILMDRCHTLHVSHKSSPKYANTFISDDLGQLLPSVKIWTTWMSCQKLLWSLPPPEILKTLSIGFNKNIWVSFADLLTILHEIDISEPRITNQRSNDCEPIILEEDITFAGFVPLLEALHNPSYVQIPFDKTRAKHCLRISQIQFFGDYLCGISPPYMIFDFESKKFMALRNQISLEEAFDRSVHLNSDDLHKEDSLNDDPEDNIYDDYSDNELQELWSRKEALSKAKEKQERYRAQIQAVLQKHHNQRQLQIRVKPKYLIPDTNCFIDHWKLFQNILVSTDFYLIIPLVVINELDGLARGTKVNENVTPEHTNRVTTMSREAINFLEQQFASRHPHLRAITSKGSVLDTICFRSEEMGANKGTNDDLILTCCLNYCKDRAENYMPKLPDDPITLFREVVLLTDDRNLRVKAIAHNVPVRSLLSFLEWVNS